MKGTILSNIKTIPYVPPVAPDQFFFYFSALGAVGIFFAMAFFMYVLELSHHLFRLPSNYFVCCVASSFRQSHFNSICFPPPLSKSHNSYETSVSNSKRSLIKEIPLGTYYCALSRTSVYH